MPIAQLGPTWHRMWRASPLLTLTGLLMAPVLAAALAGVALDPRLVTGAPVWLKPAKFAASIAIYTLTLAWVCTWLMDWVKTRRVVGWITAAALVLEIAVIAFQAWRGVASHFNVGTPLDAALFGVMGIAIVVQTMASIAVAVALWRQPFADRGLGWALRLGVAITIAGAFSGGLMVGPTGEQIEEARSSRLTLAGAHTVGASDGGPGLAATGWSVEHGDLRVPHFLGLHAMQLLPLLALAIPRRWPQTARAGVAMVSGASYAALFGILLWQALRGEPLVAPSASTLAVLGVWFAATSSAIWRLSSARMDDAARPNVYGRSRTSKSPRSLNQFVNS